MYYVLMSFPSYLFVYEIFFIRFLLIPIFWVYAMELKELKLLRHLSLDFSVILRHNTNCDTLQYYIEILYIYINEMCSGIIS